MSEVVFLTTVGHYVIEDGHLLPRAFSDPLAPTLEEGWTYMMTGSAAADGCLFWFWRCEKPEPTEKEIVHAVRHVENDVFALCEAGPPRDWPATHKWSDDPKKITCPHCQERL